MGSSPLTRGKRLGEQGAARRVRLIPAHAGKTRCTRHRARQSTAHPRSRGENPSFSAMLSAVFGSSPLTRGKHPDDGADGGGLGLIPAHAGKTRSHLATRGRSQAHPRSRGENSTGEYFGATSLGSSPLTRGKRFGGCGEHAVRRLIPAHAGKTPDRWERASSARAHPRSRGENHLYQAMCATEPGSSPLTRGKRRLS